MISEVRAVTIVTADLERARRLYAGLLGMREVAAYRLEGDEGAAVARRWALPSDTPLAIACLEQPGARSGAVRLVRFESGNPPAITDGARTYDHGYVKNLDFFTDDVPGAYERFVAAGERFLAPPVTYPLSWGSRVTATEAHLPTPDGVKVSLAGMSRVPRRAFGESSRDAAFTEVAAATQIVSDYDAAVRFYARVFDCVPAAETVVDDAGLVAALGLPPETRLRMSFIGPPAAVGGKVGLVAYEGPRVADSRSLSAHAAPSARGVRVMTFETDDVDRRHALALLNGAAEIAPPADGLVPPLGRVRTSSFRSPDGAVLEIYDPSPAAAFVPVLDAGDVTEGRLTVVARPEVGRVALTRIAGAVVALEDRCPHLGAPLSAGTVTGRRVVCPWHGWVIDLATAKVEGGEGVAARPCAARVIGGQVCLRKRDSA
ncbi:MAG: Rieske 2Fe-2S domain-containing protein [Acidobacteria bacterium]|nr:Rieske 2Fe-2S domain-containing protein [Acidobacteriota bacterium]